MKSSAWASRAAAVVSSSTSTPVPAALRCRPSRPRPMLPPTDRPNRNGSWKAVATEAASSAASTRARSTPPSSTVPRGGREQAAERQEQGGLAGAGGADHGQRGACRDVEGDVDEGRGDVGPRRPAVRPRRRTSRGPSGRATTEAGGGGTGWASSSWRRSQPARLRGRSSSTKAIRRRGKPRSENRLTNDTSSPVLRWSPATRHAPRPTRATIPRPGRLSSTAS